MKSPAKGASDAGAAPRFAVVGTAGHTDHGKSALVRALTGIDPDRLAEEQRRGMTIDLGFTHLDLPGGLSIGFVDVPGHEGLIRNMLAGAAGFDLVLLVVAADEGVMPQTREHLDILTFLRVPKGIVVLTKRDLVDDEWLAMVTEDVRAFVAGTFLAAAPVVAVSARTGDQLPALVEAITAALADGSPRSTAGPARLPIDRAFVMPGFGTVVTGTMWSGRVTVDDTLSVLPRGLSARVRGLQSHGRAIDSVRAGQRAALNLVGVARYEIGRGDVLVTPGAFVAASTFDVKLRLLGGAPALKHLDRVRFHVGTSEAIGRVALLEAPRLEPGGAAMAQLRLESPIVAARGDPFVLRRFSPMVTLGGGDVLDVDPSRHRRGDAETLARLAALEGGNPRAAVGGALERAGTAGATIDAVARTVGGSRADAAEILAALAAEGAVRIAKDRHFLVSVVEAQVAEAMDALRAYHARMPWRTGMPRTEWATLVRRRAGDTLASLVLEAVEQRTARDGEFVRDPSHHAALSASQGAARDRIAARLTNGGVEGLAKDELAASLGRDAEPVLQTLLDDGSAVELRGILFSRAAVDAAAERVASYLEAHGELTVSSAREVLGASRKFVLPVLEHFDTVGITRRRGETRVAGPRARRSSAGAAEEPTAKPGT